MLIAVFKPKVAPSVNVAVTGGATDVVADSADEDVLTFGMAAVSRACTVKEYEVSGVRPVSL